MFTTTTVTERIFLSHHHRSLVGSVRRTGFSQGRQWEKEKRKNFHHRGIFSVPTPFSLPPYAGEASTGCFARTLSTSSTSSIAIIGVRARSTPTPSSSAVALLVRNIVSNNNKSNNIKSLGIRRPCGCWNRNTFSSSAAIRRQQPPVVPVAPAVSTSGGGSSSSRWKRIARIIRTVRIPLLVISVYSLGYQQGVIDCTKEPVALQNQMMTGILVSTGCKDPKKDVNIVSENDISWHSRKRHHLVAGVGHKIVSTARDYVEAELEQAMKKVKANLPADVKPEDELMAMEKSELVQFWYHARLRLEGEAVVKQPWQYIFIESDAPNAFVTEILPRRFFITTAMLKIAETPDELAVVLGHEVSHLIMGHVSNTNKIETLLRTVEVLLLSLDPTAGLISVFVMGFLYASRKALSAAHSRGNEVQADELGLKLAARACYDTKAGSQVMYKMHEAATGMASTGKDVVPTPQPDGGTVAVVRLMDTHPPSLDRWEQMQRAAAEGENYKKYPECANISTRFFNALWSTMTDSGNKKGDTSTDQKKV